MALTFGASDSDRVALAAGLDNQHTFTMLFWLYKTTESDFRRVFDKGDAAKALLEWNAAVNDLYFQVKRATTNAVAISTLAALPTNQWTYIAVTFDTTDGPRIFSGSLTSAAAEVSYSSRTVGSGAGSDDSSFPWYIGQDSSGADASAFRGRIALAAHYRRRFSLAEINAYQFQPRNDADCDIFMHLGFNGTGTQPNLASLSGGINGTVTGATVSGHVPLGSPFAAGNWMPYVVAAGAPPPTPVRTRLSLLGVA